jgi:hypothetical protein
MTLRGGLNQPFRRQSGFPVGHDLTPSEAREVVDKTLGALQEARPITSRAVARGTRDYLEGVQEGVLDLPN